MKKPNHYADFGIDRVSDRRRDHAWVRELLESAETLILPTWRSKNLVRPGEEPRAVHLRVTEARQVLDDGGELVLLGLKNEVAYFAVDVSHHEEPHVDLDLAAHGEFVELRSVGQHMPRDEGGMLAYARGIMHWHATHRYCGACGASTKVGDAGFLRTCTNSNCGRSHFPRTDPAVIMLVANGDKVVLGRKAEWPDGMYSTLAGFVEPGESLEEAVIREVYEESAVVATNVRYHSSQPWPFPSSLMLGFYADTETEEIVINDDELEDARWFTREELANGAAGIAARPRSDSIARRLIDEWIRMGE